MSLVDKVRDKIEEYGIKIFNDYSVEGCEYIFFVEDMILFINESTKTIGVSFQVTTRPDRVGRLMLVLNEIKINIDIMDSFIFNKDNKYISGDEAFEIVDNKKKVDIIKDFVKEQTQMQILLSSDAYEC